jgi:5-methylcytosine-specific restriction endonuclease McrA
MKINELNRYQEIINNLSIEVKELLELNDFIESLFLQITALKRRNSVLEKEIDSLRKEKKDENLVDYLNELKNQNQTNFGLINLIKLNEEALFDAINRFNKLCPYCDKELYEGNIRKKIEIDHFFPIDKGGQDFPWNILPCCKECNRKKSNKMPYNFLNTDRYETCNQYLTSVKERITGNHEDKLSKLEITNNLLQSHQSKIISRENLLNELFIIHNIFNPNEINLKFDPNYDKFKLIGAFLNVVSQEKNRFILTNKNGDKTYFCVAEAIKIYKKNVINESKRIDLYAIKRIFRNEINFLETEKIVTLNRKSIRCQQIISEKITEKWGRFFYDLLNIESII